MGQTRAATTEKDVRSEIREEESKAGIGGNTRSRSNLDSDGEFDDGEGSDGSGSDIESMPYKNDDMIFNPESGQRKWLKKTGKEHRIDF